LILTPFCYFRKKNAFCSSALFTYKQLELSEDIEEHLPQTIGAQDWLIQVVINLISNAVKFTYIGSFICRARKTNQKITISIIDTGSCISEADHPKLLEKFKQVGDTFTPKKL